MGNNEVPVFDDLGRLVGWFRPVGGGCTALLAWIVAIAIVAIILLPFWLLWKGVQLWERGQKDPAVLAWITGVALILIPIGVVLNHQHTQRVQAQQQEEQRAARQASYNEAYSLVPRTTVVAKVQKRTYGNYGQIALDFTVWNGGKWPIVIGKIYWPREGFSWRETCTLWGRMGGHIHTYIPGGTDLKHYPNTSKTYSCETTYRPQEFVTPPAICLAVYLEALTYWPDNAHELCVPIRVSD